MMAVPKSRNVCKVLTLDLSSDPLAELGSFVSLPELPQWLVIINIYSFIIIIQIIYSIVHNGSLFPVAPNKTGSCCLLVFSKCIKFHIQVQTQIPFAYCTATRGARNPNLQVITHASHVCSQHLFGIPLRMNGIHITQFDHARLDLQPLIIWSHVFWPSVMWNLCKAQRESKNVLTFDHSCLHSVTFAYH